jgi:outer membrane protein OmpA-like peptidoglycan-associated protein
LRNSLKIFAATAALALFLPQSARADDETWLLTIDATALQPLTQPHRHEFGLGLGLGAGVYRSFSNLMLGGLRFRSALQLDDDPPENPRLVDKGLANVLALMAAMRFRPFSSADDVRRGTGFYVEVAAGAGPTGDEFRPMFEAGVGVNFEAADLGVGPTLRLMHIFQPNSEFEPTDAWMAMAGVEVVMLDSRPEPVVAGDRDGDGFIDSVDDCPDDPEDFDRFEDADGCPEPDNDRDGILDVDDACPNDPEDMDGFEDTDGCPDRDNDQDTIPDTLDHCPNEPETFNRYNDHDGCPDIERIEVVDGRFVVDERVFFEFDRAEVRAEARSTLDQIVALWRENQATWRSIRIEGHADVRGRREYNMDLSQRRAENVRASLVQLGIPEANLRAVGFGETQPRAEGNTEEVHQRNRRVEFVVITEETLRGVEVEQHEHMRQRQPPERSERPSESNDGEGAR